ncbi:MAG: M15 family metallopeptidase [Rhizobium sp.]|nr:M15 family metallopeptidase [Rhizobium sp.]
MRTFAAALVSAFLTSTSLAAELTLDEKLDILARSYPATIAGVADGHVTFISKAEAVIVDDGKARDHFQMLETGDVEDSLQQLYPAGACETRPDVNFDPGRIRSERMMKAMYGVSSKAVAGSLVPVKWFGETLRVTKINGVDKALEAVRDELVPRSDLRKYLTPSAGVFNWRKVSKQSNLSVHSFGAAIDLNTRYADYWDWSGGKPGRVPVYKNKFPMEIVAIFEKHGFIWGGRWYHYDTMHFEYRPELLEIAKRSGVSACK